MHCTTITIPFQELAAAQEDSATTQWYRTELHEQVQEVRHFKSQLLAVQESRDGLQAQVAVLESCLAYEALAAADSEALLRDATETAAHQLDCQVEKPFCIRGRIWRSNFRLDFGFRRQNLGRWFEIPNIENCRLMNSTRQGNLIWHTSLSFEEVLETIILQHSFRSE